MTSYRTAAFSMQEPVLKIREYHPHAAPPGCKARQILPILHNSDGARGLRRAMRAAYVVTLLCSSSSQGLLIGCHLMT
jgi:hypothetical protein